MCDGTKGALRAVFFGRVRPDFKRPPTAAMAADHGVLGLVCGLREPGDTVNPSARAADGARGRAGRRKMPGGGCRKQVGPNTAQLAL